MKNLQFFILVSSICIISSCSDNEEVNQQQSWSEENVIYAGTEESQPKKVQVSRDQSEKSQTSKFQFPAFSRSELLLTDEQGQEIASLKVGNTNQILVNGNLYKSKIAASGKNKYFGPSGQLIAKINRYDDGFKLKDGAGNILWKVKFKENRIKLANNNEMTNAYKIKYQDTGNIMIYQDEEALGSVLIENGQAKTRLQNSTFLKLQYFSSWASAGIIGVTEIPLVLQMILIAEIEQKR